MLTGELSSRRESSCRGQEHVGLGENTILYPYPYLDFKLKNEMAVHCQHESTKEKIEEQRSVHFSS